MDKNSKIYVAGHRGLVGSSLIRRLSEEGFHNVITKTSKELDLRDSNSVSLFFEREKPEYVFLAAAKVGGIYANQSQPASFIYDNLVIQNNIIHNSYLNNVKKLLFLGSSCIYPKLCLQPIKEEYLLTGELEPTNEPYAIAKIAGIKMCHAYNTQYHTNYLTVMPTNLYGPNDNFNLLNSHVLPALIRKFHDAKVNGEPFVEVWGTGSPRREFLHVDDLADACIYLIRNFNSSDVNNDIINIGTGVDISIKNLAELIKDITKYDGELKFNSDKPDGTPRKLLDVSRVNTMGWKHKINLESGIASTYDWFLTNATNIRE